MKRTKEISIELYHELDRIGLIPSKVNSKNIGSSDYANSLIQPWVIFNSHPNLNYQECDIIKRILRTKEGESRLLDLERCHHILDELIRQEKLETLELTRQEEDEVNFKNLVEEAVLKEQPDFMIKSKYDWWCNITVNDKTYEAHHFVVGKPALYIYDSIEGERGEVVLKINVAHWEFDGEIYSSSRVDTPKD